MTEFAESPPAGWFILDVMRREEGRKWDWAALMVNVDPEDLKTFACDFPALLYVDPNEHRPAHRMARRCWVCIPGKHRSKLAAWAALKDIMATRH